MKISAKIFLLFSFLCLGWQTFTATAHADLIVRPPTEDGMQRPVNQATAESNPPPTQPDIAPLEPSPPDPYQSIDPKLLLVFVIIVGISLVTALILIFLRFKSPLKSLPSRKSK